MRRVHKTGNRLKELRLEHGTLMRELSALTQRDQSMISRYETGQSGVPDDVKLALAKHYGVSVSYLMGWDESEVAA